MFYWLRRLRWDWKDPIGRFNLLNAFWRLIPGGVGAELRARKIAPYFASCGEDLLIQEGVRFRGVHKIHIGNHVGIGVDSFLQASGGLTLEDNVLLGPSVKIWTINHRFDELDKPIKEQGYNIDPVVIGAGCWLGANVIILPGVQLPPGCIVSAGSVVGKKRYPANSLIAGFPARVIGKREDVDKEHELPLIDPEQRASNPATPPR